MRPLHLLFSLLAAVPLHA
jgi:hypothetical protein